MGSTVIKNDYFSKENTNCLRGILSIGIIISHCRGALPFLNGSFIGYCGGAIGYLVVGVFFFITGFGIKESVKKKSEYRNTFVRRRVIPFYADYLLFLAFYLIVAVIRKLPITLEMIIKSLTFSDTYVENGWYFQAALVVYLGFALVWLIKRKFNKIHEGLFLVILWLLYVVLCTVSGLRSLWTQSIIGVVLGYVWSVYKTRIDRLLAKYWWLCLIITMLLFGATTVLGHFYFTGIFSLAVVMASVCFFIILVMTLLMKIPIQCGLTRFLGSISTEIYVIHGMWIWIWSKVLPLTQYPMLFVVVMIISSVIGARVLKQIRMLYHKLIRI